MNEHALESLLFCRFQQCVKVILVGVHASVRDEAEEVQLASAFAGQLQGMQDRRMVEELAASNQVIDACDVHVDDAASADVQVTDFAVAHLSVWQADEMIGSVQKRVWIFRKQLVVDRLAGQRNRVVLNLRAVAPPVEDGEYDGPGSGLRWGWDWRLDWANV